MAIEKNAVFLLTSADGSKKAFGTGFAVAHADGQLHLLTCAHVAEQLDGRIQAAGQEAEILAKGSADGVDLALLRIPCEQPPPLLNRAVQGKEGMRFHICGYGPFAGAKDNYVLRHIEGKLGKSIAFESPGSGRVEAWDLHVEDDDFSRLQGGYSGSPLCDEQGRLIAVVSHKVDAGPRGHAVAIANLKSIYPEIEQFIPSFFTPRPAAAPADRFARVGKRFKSLLFDFDLDDSLCKVVRNEFKRMEEEGIAADDEELLEKIENAAEGAEEWTALVRFLEALDAQAKNAAAGPNYAALAKQLAKGEVILCLGQELPHLLGAQLPSTEELKQRLRQGDFASPLSELCEEKLIAPDSDRTDLVNVFRELLDKRVPSVSLHELLARLERPFIVISAGYDDLLQSSLRAWRRDVVEIYPNVEEKTGVLNYVLIHSNGKDDTCTPENVSDHQLIEKGCSVIYRLRGGIVSGKEHLLLSERDYFTFNKVMKQQNQFPDYIGSKLNSSLYSLWFLGHHPTSWEERLLISFLRDMQHPDFAAVAVQEHPPEFDRNFWQSKRVKVFAVPLADFVQNLEAAL